MCGLKCLGTCEQVRGGFVKADSLHLPCRFQGLNSIDQAY